MKSILPEPSSDVRLHQDEAHLPQDDAAKGQIRHHPHHIQVRKPAAELQGDHPER